VSKAFFKVVYQLNATKKFGDETLPVIFAEQLAALEQIAPLHLR